MTDAGPATVARRDTEPRILFDRDEYLRYRSRIRDDAEAVRQRYGASDRYVELEYSQLTDLERMAVLLESLFGEPVRLEARLDRQRPRPKIEYVANAADAEEFEHDSLRAGFRDD